MQVLSPAYQEQPGAHRRARRRQDRRRRGAGPAHRRRRRARVAARTSGWSRSTSARWSPARSTAASSRSGSRPCSTRSRTADGQVITFIDELHTVVGAGATGEGAMDAGNMLKPMLARGELRMVGATTLDEYRERDREGPRAGAPLPAGVRRRADRRGHHRDPARAQGAVRGAPQGRRSPTPRWSPRRRCPTATSPRRFLPDKAIDLVDEAASRLRMEIDSSAGRDRRAAARRRPAEDGGAARSPRRPTPAVDERLERLRADLADQQEELRGARTPAGSRRRPGLNRVGELKERLDELRGQAERAQREGDFETASRLLYGEIPELREGARRGAARPSEDAADGDGQGGGRPRRHRRGGRGLDRHPGRPAARGRDRPSCCGWRTSSASG